MRTIPITRGAGSAPRSVMSLKPSKLPRMRRGDKLKLNAEVQVTTTCVTASPRCIGRPYGFTPHVTARLVLADGRRAARGHDHVRALSRPQRIGCHQERPNRNHHCVLVFRNVVRRLGKRRSRPCGFSHCHVNLVLSAHSPAAEPGNELIIGADRPNGTVEQDMGRLNAILIPRGAKPHVRSAHTRKRVRHRLREGSPGSGGWRVLYSLKLRHLERGDIVDGAARSRLAIGGLPYSAYVASELVIAGRRTSVHPFRHDVTLDGSLTEANGFNCTQGPSAYQTPCVTRKAGMARIRRHPVNRHGRPRPLYLNLISRSFPKLAHARRGDAARVLGGGFVTATIFPKLHPHRRHHSR